MPLDVNGYNEQFKAFVSFATEKTQNGKGKAIARLGDLTAPKAPRKVDAAASDGVGGFAAMFRSKSNQTANETARTIFREAILDMFGGESKIPEDIKNAMRLKDYGAGKPLTARRIMIVKEAVDRFQSSVVAAQVHANYAYTKAGEDREKIDTRIRNAVLSCADDPDLLSVVVQNMDAILVRGDGVLRDDTAVQKRINDLKANFAEVRQLAQDNPALLGPGIKFLKAMNGKILQQGLIGKMIDVAYSLPIDKLMIMTASSKGDAIHKGIAQFLDGVNAVMKDSDADILVEGSDEKLPCRDFAADIILARCGKSACKNIQAALNTTTATKMLALYATIRNGKFNKQGMSEGHISATKDQAAIHSCFLNQLKLAADDACGIPHEKFVDLEAYEGDFRFEEINAGNMLQDLKDSGIRQLQAQLESMLKNQVKGTGQAAENIKAVIKHSLAPETYEPNDVISKAARQIAQSMLNWTLASDCKRFAEGKGDQTVFFEDLVRGLNVKLPNGKMLSNDFETARDEIAQFVTRKADAKYDTLDAKAKNKAHIVMSLLSQDSMKAAFDGNSLALDPKKNKTVLNTVNHQETEGRNFTLELEKNGALVVKFEGKLRLKAVTTTIGNDVTTVEVADGSTYTSSFSLEISGAEFNRLASLDFSKFDAKAAKDAFTADPKPENGTDRNKMGRTIDTFAPEFKFAEGEISCDTSFTAEIK